MPTTTRHFAWLLLLVHVGCMAPTDAADVDGHADAILNATPEPETFRYAPVTRLPDGTYRFGTPITMDLKRGLVRLQMRREVESPRLGKLVYWQTYCSGTVIDRHYVLTAAHCLREDDGVFLANPLRVQAGFYEASITQSSVRFAPGLDVALIRLPTPYDSFVSRELLYTDHPETLFGRTVTCYGAGNSAYPFGPSTPSGKMGSAQLRVEDPRVSGRHPSNPFPYSPDEVHLATSATGQQLAPGDSGGSCYVNVNGFPRLVGVTSYGTYVVRPDGYYESTNGLPEEYGVLVSTNAFRSWLLEEVYGTSSALLEHPWADPDTTAPSAGSPTRVELADVNGDDVLDFVRLRSDRIVVRRGVGDRTFGAPSEYPHFVTEGVSNWSDARAHLADVNGDGRTDFVFTYDNSVRTRLATSSGGFGQFVWTTYGNNVGGGTGWDHDVALADVNGDGKDDLIFRRADGLYVRVANANGDGHFMPTVRTTETFASLDHVRFADLNGDGRADLVRVGASTVRVRHGATNGTFGPAVDSPLGVVSENDIVEVVLAEVDVSLGLDLVLVGESDTWALSGNTGGTFALPVHTPLVAGGPFPDAPHVAVRQPGLADFFAVRDGLLVVQRAEGDGGFARPQVRSVVSFAQPVASALEGTHRFGDLDNDGYLDFVHVDDVGRQIVVHGGRTAAP